MVSRFSTKNNLTRIASLNIIASGIDNISKLIVGFILTPLMVSGLGEYFYGIWQILNRLFSYLSTTSGSTSALKFILSKEQSMDNFSKKRSYLGSSLVVWIIFLPITSLLGGLITWFVPFWLNTPKEYIFQIRIVSIIFVILTMVHSLSYLPYTILQGENQGYRRIGISILVFSFNGFLTWLALYLETGIIGVSVSLLVQTIVSGVFYLLISKTYIPWLGVRKPSIQLVKLFLNFSGWFLVWDIVSNLTKASDVVVLGMFDSVGSVTTYTLTKYIPEIIITFSGLLVSGIIPGLGGIIGGGDIEKAIQIRGEMFSFTWLMITVIGVSTLLWNRFFLELWVGSHQYAGQLSNLLIVLVISQFALIKTDGFIIDLKINIKSKVVWGAISTIISIGIGILFVQFLNLGIIGISVGLLIGRSILSIIYPKIVSDYLRIALISQIKKIIKPMLITLMLFGIASYFDSLTINYKFSGMLGWIHLLLGVSLSSIFVLVFAFLTGISRNQRKKLLLRVKSIIPK